MPRLELNPQYIDPPDLGELDDFTLIGWEGEDVKNEMQMTPYEGVNFENIVISQWAVELLALRNMKRLDFTHCMIPKGLFKLLYHSLQHIETLRLYDNIITTSELNMLFKILYALYQSTTDESDLPLKTLIIAQKNLPSNLDIGIFNSLQTLDVGFADNKALRSIFEVLRYDRSIKRFIIRNTSFDELTIEYLSEMIHTNSVISEYEFDTIEMDQENAILITAELGVNTNIRRLKFSYSIDDIIQVMSGVPHLEVLVYTNDTRQRMDVAEFFKKLSDYNTLRHLGFMTSNSIEDFITTDVIHNAFRDNKSIISFDFNGWMLPSPTKASIQLYLVNNR